MDHASFHVLRKAVQENARPADDLKAQSLQRRLSEALIASQLFDQVELGRTDDPDQLVIGLCRCAERILPWEAGVGVERLWSTVAADAPWESHSVACSETLMEFEGAVTVDTSGHFITVRLLAEPPAVRPHAVPEHDGDRIAFATPVNAREGR